MEIRLEIENQEPEKWRDTGKVSEIEVEIEIEKRREEIET
jgi:hypothetical protein